ncbi:MAG: DUF4340 domain-containing protein [Kiritimatiellae bacterium]|nr:DUF4340 domain-containing protein [Kiritimatiellia bacterium]
MKSKHLIILACIVIILGIIYAVQRKGSGSTAPSGTRELVPASFSSDGLSDIRFKGKNGVVTLKQTPSGWVVAERYNYPADVAKLREFFIKLCDARIAQELPLTAKQAEELSLTPEKAVTVTMSDRNAKPVHTFLFGSEHTRGGDAAMNNPYGGMSGNGRYIQLADGRNALVQDTFSEVDTATADWLNKEFFQISDPRHAVLKRNGKVEWELETKNGSLVLKGAVPPDREVDDTKISSLKNAYSWIRFTDVADPKAAAAKTGMDKAPELTLTDSDDLVYTIRPGAGADGKYFLRVSVAWKGAAKRTPPAGEKAEDKAKLDAEFAKTVKERQEKAAKLNKMLGAWTFEVGKDVYDSSAATRDSFLKEKPKKTEEPAKK